MINFVPLDPMPTAYQDILSSAVDHFSSDPRVRSLWLSGAVARGAQDAGSDLDIVLTVADEAFEDLVATHEEWLSAVLATVSLVRMGTAPGWYALTPTCERVDFLLERSSDLPDTRLPHRTCVFDRDDNVRSLPAEVEQQIDPAAVDFALREAIRQMANFPVVFVRGDWLLGVVAVQQLHYFLYELFVQANRPQPPTGPKQWSSKLSPEARELLEALPVPQPTPESVMAAHRAAVDVFELWAPRIADQADVTWPEELHNAVKRHRVTAYPRAWFGSQEPTIPRRARPRRLVEAAAEVPRG